jgi:hypothetical protein
VKSLPSKQRILKKKKEKKRKREKEKKEEKKEVKPHMKKLHVSKGEKKKKDEIYKLLGEILSKEGKKGEHIFL